MDQTIVVEVHPTVKAVLEGEGNSWSAYVPSVPGCIATGSSVEEVMRRIEKAVTISLADTHEVEFTEIQAELKAESPA